MKTEVKIMLDKGVIRAVSLRGRLPPYWFLKRVRTANRNLGFVLIFEP